MNLPSWSAPAGCLLAALLVIGWNLAQGVRLSALPAAKPALRGLAGLSAFLLLPALAIALLASTAAGARVLGAFAWLWPVTSLGVLLAGVMTLAHGRGVWDRVILVLYDALAAWIAVTHWLQSAGVALAPWASAPGAAASTLVAGVLGDAAFPWGAVLVIPVMVPATPSPARMARAATTTVTVGVAALAAGILAIVPRTRASLVEAAQLVAPAPSGTRGALAVGLRLFGDLSSPPSAVVALRDVALADSLSVTVVHVALKRPDISNAALDSIARTLAPRRDSITLIVSLRLPVPFPRADTSAERARLAALERIARRLRPDVLVPADRVELAAAEASVPDVIRHYERVATRVQRINRRIVIALGTDASSESDSVAVEWVMSGSAPVSTIALAVRDHGVSPERFVGALAAVSRWASLGRRPPGTWLLGVPSAPTVTGERVQQHLVRYALAWATASPWVRGVVAGDASDVAGPVALRTAGGRRRLALAEVVAALRLQRDAAAGAATDASIAPTAPAPPDTSIRPSELSPP